MNSFNITGKTTVFPKGFIDSVPHSILMAAGNENHMLSIIGYPDLFSLGKKKKPLPGMKESLMIIYPNSIII